MTTQNISLEPKAPKTLKVHARGEDFRVVQFQGNLIVCTKANGSCCCGWTEKGRAPVNIELYQQEWEGRKIRNKVHLTFAGCLGPCAVGNNALLQLFGRSVWFKDLNDDALIPALFEYIETMLRAGQVLPPPTVLANTFMSVTYHRLKEATHRWALEPRMMARVWSDSIQSASWMSTLLQPNGKVNTMGAPTISARQAVRRRLNARRRSMYSFGSSQAGAHRTWICKISRHTRKK